MFYLVHRTGLSYEAMLYSLVTFCESLHSLGVPLDWTAGSRWEERFYLRSFLLKAPDLILLSLFIQPLVDDPPSKLEPKVLSCSLNRLCDIGLKITSSTAANILCVDPIDIHEYKVIPSIAFPDCYDIIEGMVKTE